MKCDELPCEGSVYTNITCTYVHKFSWLSYICIQYLILQNICGFTCCYMVQGHSQKNLMSGQ